MKEKKKLIIITLTILILIIGIVIAIILLRPKKEEKTTTENKIEVMRKITILETPDSAKAAELIKSNIVKITNEVEDIKVTGTGFFHESGYLVTNSHIVDLKGIIKVKFNDGTETEATLVANDMTSDIAILSVKESKGLALTFGNTLNLKVTDELYAIGYPFALEGEATTTKGILSARRSAGGIEYLQTDMSLNSGNSGGPLINSKAEVFGMTTYATENASIGMSISAESLESIIKKLIEKKEVNYLEDDRETNALSTILTEIGHKDDDIYKEKERLDKIKEQKKHETKEESNKEESNKDKKDKENNSKDKINSNNKKEESITNIKKSNDNRLKTLKINGINYKISQEENTVSINVRQKSLAALDIEAVANHEKALVEIIGNKYVEAGKNNKVTIEVTAENGEKFAYIIDISTTKPTLDRLAKVIVVPHSKYDSSSKEYYLDLSFIEGRDRENGYLEEQADPYTEMEVILYGNNKELKSYSFNLLTTTPRISLTEIREMLSEEDYTYTINDEPNAYLTMKITIDTVEQGKFTYNDAYYWLPK